MIYRKVKIEDVSQVAEIHKEQFKGHLLAECSRKLVELFYQGFIDEQIVFLVAEKDGVIKGFVLGGEGDRLNNVQYNFMSKYGLRCALEAAIHPQTWILVWNKLKSHYFSSIKKSADRDLPNKPSQENHYWLLSIAVSSNSKREGVGRGLVCMFDKEMSSVCDMYCLCVNKDNETGLAFYNNMGFAVDYQRPTFYCMSKTILKE